MTESDLIRIINSAIQESFKTHVCFLSQEDKQLVKDMVTGAKLVKKSIITSIVGFILFGLGFMLYKGVK